MKVLALKCPNCDASIKDEKISFCPYCGSKLFIDDGTRRVEINKNIHISQSVSKYQKDEAAILRAKIEDKRNKRERWMEFISEHGEKLSSFVLIIFLFGMMLLGINHLDTEEESRKSVGVYIKTSAKGYEGEDYKTVVAELEALGKQ